MLGSVCLQHCWCTGRPREEQSETVVAQIAKSLELSEYLPGLLGQLQRCSASFWVELVACKDLARFLAGAKIPPSIGLFVVLDGDVQARTFGAPCECRSKDPRRGLI